MSAPNQFYKPGNFALLKQPPVPAHVIMPQTRPDTILVSGTPLTCPPLDARVPVKLYTDIRKDLAKFSPIPITRSALRYVNHTYVGIIDSEGSPHYFALGSTGLALRKAPNSDAVWQAFDEMMEDEQLRAVCVRRLQSVMEQEAQTVEMTSPPLVIAKSEAHTGVMVSLHLPFDVARRVALDGGEAPKDLHITLAYLGKDLNDRQKEGACAAVRHFASKCEGIKVKLGGIGRFSASHTSDGKDVVYLSVDSPDITRLRQRLLDALVLFASVEPKTDHGFVPHVTLAYIDQSAPTPVQRVAPIDVVFHSIACCIGEKRSTFEFGPALVLAKGMRRKGAGSRGSTKWYLDSRGKVRYGERPMHDHHVGVHFNDKHGMSSTVEKKIYTHLKKKKPETLAEMKQHVYDWCIADGDSPEDAKRYVKDWTSHLHENEAIHFNDSPAQEADSGDLMGKLTATKEMLNEKQGGERLFKKQQATAKPTLYKATAPNAQLLVNGRPVKLSADAGAACLAYAKRFLVNAGDVKHRAAFDKGFNTWLQKEGVPRGTYDFKQFVKAAQSEIANATSKPRGKAVEITPKTHPHMFVMRDGKQLQLAEFKLPTGNFYSTKTGKHGHGTWVRPIREEEMIFNGTNPPPGWKGQVINDATKRYVYAWKHPDSGAWGYVEPKTTKVGADLEKFERSSRMAKHLETSIRPILIHDIENAKDQRLRAAALCTYLIDAQKFRVGGEDKAQKSGTFGISSLRAKHVTVDGSHVVFEFTGKAQQAWKRVVDFSHLPEALSFIKELKKGKDPDDKLWSGKQGGGKAWNVYEGDINDYLSRFPVDGHKITAKDFRTFHANAYVKEMLPKLAAVEKAFDLPASDVRAMLDGFDPKKKPHLKKLLSAKYKHGTVASFLGLHEYDDGKKRLHGVVPTVAQHLGHTTSSCRNSYIDPIAITKFTFDRGWDGRTLKEKRSRPDLPAPEKKAKK